MPGKIAANSGLILQACSYDKSYWLRSKRTEHSSKLQTPLCKFSDDRPTAFGDIADRDGNLGIQGKEDIYPGSEFYKTKFLTLMEGLSDLNITFYSSRQRAGDLSE